MTQHFTDQPQTHEHPAALCPFAGAILGLQGDVLHGWAVDTAQPELRPVIEIFIDGASVAITRADQYEPQSPFGDQFHGFAVQLRQSWLDQARMITAQFANQPFALEGQVTLPATPSFESTAITSQAWHTGGLRIGGWCWDPQAPRRHVQVTVREGTKVIGQAICNIHNQALAYRATSDHGFALDLPWELADGKLHILDVVNDLGHPLCGSPIRLCCRPEGMEGLLKQLDSTQNSATLALLNVVAKEQCLRLPKSAGWNSYPQWFEAFQRLDSSDIPPMQGKIGLLLISEGDAGLEQASITSLGDCRALMHQLVIASPTDLSAAIAQLLEAGCDRILPIAAGDRLAPLALAHFSALLDDGTAWAYADCDRDGPQGERSHPWLKPVWDIDLFIGADIFTPGAIFGSRIVEHAIALLSSQASDLPLSWDYLTAAIALATQEAGESVAHLPRILYHRAIHRAPSPEQAETSPSRQKAVEWLCNRLAPGATVSTVPEYSALLRVQWPLPEKMPRVSLIVPTRDQYKLLHACVEGLLNDTDYPNLEIIVVDNQSSDPETLAYLNEIERRGVIVLPHPYPFNYSTINNRAASVATGELIGLVNNDIEIIDAGWLKEMVAQALQPGVGAVGAKLLWPNRMVQHAGVVVGINGLAAHTGNHLAENDPGYMGLNQISRKQSAVTAACLLLRKRVFDAVEGLDENLFPVAFNDVDLCLRIKQRGMHILWSAFAKLVHAESASRGKDQTPEKQARARREQENFVRSWQSQNVADPCYHPSLSTDFLTGPFCGLAIPPTTLQARLNNTLILK